MHTHIYARMHTHIHIRMNTDGAANDAPLHMYLSRNEPQLTKDGVWVPAQE